MDNDKVKVTRNCIFLISGVMEY